jgi:hypothetical protein
VIVWVIPSRVGEKVAQSDALFFGRKRLTVTVGGAVAPPTAGSEPDVITWGLVNGTARRVPGRDSAREATPGWNTSCFSGRRFDGGFPR